MIHQFIINSSNFYFIDFFSWILLLQIQIKYRTILLVKKWKNYTHIIILFFNYYNYYVFASFANFIFICNFYFNYIMKFYFLEKKSWNIIFHTTYLYNKRIFKNILSQRHNKIMLRLETVCGECVSFKMNSTRVLYITIIKFVYKSHRSVYISFHNFWKRDENEHVENMFFFSFLFWTIGQSRIFV